jgi:hypothetical protein
MLIHFLIPTFLQRYRKSLGFFPSQVKTFKGISRAAADNALKSKRGRADPEYPPGKSKYYLISNTSTNYAFLRQHPGTTFY